ncbi:MAG: RDD family protein [Deltaproteobacteria bacterium]|jgi:uncharacterized RDD family membrane protein YckC|nr:RDD family protein [Deltaproteobacteria bacterium]
MKEKKDYTLISQQLAKLKRVIITPEGLPLKLYLSNNGERLYAFFVDCILIVFLIFLISILIALLPISLPIRTTLISFVSFLISLFYFTYFELAWRGQSPGKRFLKIKVVKRNGSELTAFSIIARNLTREVELFVPLWLFATAVDSQNLFLSLFFMSWAILCFLFPFFSRDKQRPGDLIGGTMVISLPKKLALLDDLTELKTKMKETRFVFTQKQLAIYGNKELQTLENMLRQNNKAISARAQKAMQKSMAIVCEKICRKIRYTDPVPPEQVERFLSEFYIAERDQLEKGLMYGLRKESKLDPTVRVGKPPTIR